MYGHLEHIDRFARRGIWLCLIWPMLASPAPRFPPPAIPPELAGVHKVRIEEFDLIGTTLPAIRQSLEDNLIPVRGREEEDTLYASALTSYRFSVTWERGGGAEGCRVEQVEVPTRFKILLPRLISEAPPAVTARWLRFRRALEMHEAEHVRIALAWAERIRRALPAAGCDRADAVAKELEARMDAAQETFDAGQCSAWTMGDRSETARDQCGYPYLDEPIGDEEARSVAVQPQGA